MQKFKNLKKIRLAQDLVCMHQARCVSLYAYLLRICAGRHAL